MEIIVALTVVPQVRVLLEYSDSLRGEVVVNLHSLQAGSFVKSGVQIY